MRRFLAQLLAALTLLTLPAAPTAAQVVSPVHNPVVSAVVDPAGDLFSRSSHWLDFGQRLYKVGGWYGSDEWSIPGFSPGDMGSGTFLSPPDAASQVSAFSARRTNKSTNYNTSPTDTTNVTKSGDAASTLTVVDDASALAAAGINVGNGKVYKLDNSAGSAAAFATVAGAVGNTNPHSASAWVRGTGSGRIRINSGGSDAPLPAAYTRLYLTNVTPSDNTRTFSVAVAAGAVAYFIRNQLEEASTYTQPIAVAGAAATVTDLIRTNLGAEVWEARTNKNTNYNAAPTDLTGVTKSGDAAATLTVVNDEAALRAAGFGSLIDAGMMNGNVYKLDNSAGVVAAQAAIGGQVGTTNASTGSPFVRGSGSVTLRDSLGDGATTFTLSSGYIRRAMTWTPAATTRVFQVRAEPGSIVYFILNQLEEGSFATPPIVVAGAAATRGAATPLVNIPQLSGPFVIYVEQGPIPTASSSFPRLFDLSDGTANNAFLVWRDQTQNGRVYVGATVGGVATNISTGIENRGAIRAAVRYRAGGAFGISVNGSAVSTGATDLDAAWATIRQLGIANRYDGQRPANAVTPRLIIIPGDMTDAQLRALSANPGPLGANDNAPPPALREAFGFAPVELAA